MHSDIQKVLVHRDILKQKYSWKFDTLRLEDNIEEDDYLSSLEFKTKNDIEVLCETAIGTKFEHRYPLIILYSLRHLIELKVKLLANKLRKNNSVEREYAVIKFRDICGHKESFLNMLQNESKELFYQTEAYKQLKAHNFNNRELNDYGGQDDV